MKLSKVSGKGSYKYWVSLGASIILGLILFTAGLGKQQTEALWFVATLPEAVLTPMLAHFVSLSLPWIEVIVGLLLILGIATKFAASISIVLIAAFMANNSWLIYHGLMYQPCSCFGIFERIAFAELSTMSVLYLDIGMLALALIILFWYPGKFWNIRPWFLRKGS